MGAVPAARPPARPPARLPACLPGLPACLGRRWPASWRLARAPQVPLAELAEAGEVRVRAWDDTMNTQPDRRVRGLAQGSAWGQRPR